MDDGRSQRQRAPMSLTERCIEGRYRAKLASGAFEFELIPPIGDVRLGRVSPSDILPEVTLKAGLAYPLFFERATNQGFGICRFWRRDENPWLVGTAPEAGDDVTGTVINIVSNDIALIKLDEPDDPFALTASLANEDLPDEAKGDVKQELSVGDRVRARVEAVNIFDLRIRLNCRAYLDDKRQEDAAANVADKTAGNERNRARISTPTPLRAPLAGKHIVVVDDDVLAGKTTCAWFELRGAIAAFVPSSGRFSELVAGGVIPTHVIVDFTGVRYEDVLETIAGTPTKVAMWSGAPDRAQQEADRLNLPFFSKPVMLRRIEDWVLARPQSKEQSQRYILGEHLEAGLWTGRPIAAHITRDATAYLEKLCARLDLEGAIWLRREREHVYSIQAHTKNMISSAVTDTARSLNRSCVTNAVPVADAPSRVAPGKCDVGIVPTGDTVLALFPEGQRSGMRYCSMLILEPDAKPRVVAFFKRAQFLPSTIDTLTAEGDHLHHLLQLFRLTENVDATETFAAVGRTLASTIHEIRGRLQHTQALTKHVVLKAESGSLEETKTAAAELDAAWERLRTMVEGDLGQVQKFRIDQVNLRDVIEATVYRMRVFKFYHFGYKSTQIEWRVDKRFDTRPICVSPIVVEQPLINLIDNALYHIGDHKWGRVEVEASYTDDAARPIKIVVRDNGPGLTAERREMLFEPRETSKNEQGVGLGLFASRNIVRAVGGELECTEALRWGGAEFQIRLPIVLGSLPAVPAR